ncbi:MAG: glycosyltransferase family 2 protein [Sciscionella sp.]
MSEPAAVSTFDGYNRRKYSRLLGRHWLMLAMLVVGLLLRVMTTLAYRPALLYIDSFRYLTGLNLRPDGGEPIGYDLFVLKPLLYVGGLQLVVVVQHLAGIAVGILLYRLACRLGARSWLAALAAAPVLLDGYQLQIEQNIMSDLWFQLALVLVVWTLLRRGVPTPRRAAVAGVLIGICVLLRIVAIPLVVPMVAYLLIVGWRRRAGWRARLRPIGLRVGAFLLGWMILVGAFCGYFFAVTGHVGFTSSSGDPLYGRTTVAANCQELQVSATLRQFCRPEPNGVPFGIDQYTYLATDPMFKPTLPEGTTVEQAMRQFADAVIQQQPLNVVGGVIRDFGKGFVDWTKASFPGDVPIARWQFQTSYPVYSPDTGAATQRFDGMRPTVNPTLAGILREYQLRIGYTPGPLLGIAAILGLAGAVRRRGRSGFAAWLGGAGAFVAVTGIVILLTSAAFEFSWRYQLPGLVLLPLAGVLGCTSMIGTTRVAAVQHSDKRRLAPFPDAVDTTALDDFASRYGEPDLAPVAVVIAAYNEADGIGEVLDCLPKRCCDKDVDVIVVADGCSDATAEFALKHGAFTVIAPQNRGQGAALRLGYQVAARFGAQYVVTTDADGQYDNDEMPLLLRPLLDGRADFVSGSRRLGSEHTSDRVRWLGVRVFAMLATVLTRRHITDTSFGFRAMRAELACSVRLRQPQYQSSELLVGVLSKKARYLELPMTMRKRTAGASKKGNNFLYGLRYARALTGTWLREYVGFRKD